VAAARGPRRNMPIYDYLCKECRNQFECLLLRTSAAATCPACGSPNLEQLVSSCAVHSEAASAANLSAAHRQAADRRVARQRDEHRHLHEHFEDASPADRGAKKDVD